MNAGKPSGIVVAPHATAAQAGAKILEQGGNAVEAAVATAAALCVVYPHMTGLGGDSFWLIAAGNERQTLPTFIDACGCAGQQVSCELLRNLGYAALPTRGPLAAITMAGAVSGWAAALETAAKWVNTHHVPHTLSQLFSEAIAVAEEGYAVSASQAMLTQAHGKVLSEQEGFSHVFMPHGKAPQAGERLRLPGLARVLRQLATAGLQDFYQGELAHELAQKMSAVGMLLQKEDFDRHKATTGSALQLSTKHGQFYNSPPPTQGVASLVILGQFFALLEQGKINLAQEAEIIHAIIEATKTAFTLRSAHIGDPRWMEEDVSTWLTPEHIAECARTISMATAAPWGEKSLAGGDTVWFGSIDQWGNAVSCIQSIYHEFGSGVLIPGTDILWHNRGLGFSWEKGHPNILQGGKKPFHTLNPAMALLADGRFMTYGTMGGEGQPQTQAAILTRYLCCHDTPAVAISKPRWLLGKTWGDDTNNVKIEADCDAATIEALRGKGHDLITVPACNILMGHAGMAILHPTGALEGASDPRSDGMAALSHEH